VALLRGFFMWNIFDQWVVLLALGWAVWIIIKNLQKKPACNKKIFNKNSDLVMLKIKRKA
jgi:hypothetical protein